MDVFLLSAAIAALAVAMLVLALAITVCTLVMRKPDAGPDKDPEACVVAFGPEPEAEPYSDAESPEGSFTLPLPPGFGMSTAKLF